MSQSRESDAEDRRIGEAIVLEYSGQPEAARRIYRDILKTEPGHLEVLNLSARLEFNTDHTKRALDLAQRAIGADPSESTSYANLGEFHLRSRSPFDAVAAYRAAIERDPDNPEWHYQAGIAWQQCGDQQNAERAWQTCLDLDPEHEEVYCPLAKQLLRRGRRGEAAELLRQRLKLTPDDAHARHFLAACGEGPLPNRASEEFVKKTFDGAAVYYNDNLANLNYRGPEIMGRLLHGLAQPADGQNAILDAGCGTGLCADILRPWASRLIGVDISAGMIERADGSGQYDELVVADLIAYMLEHAGQFDVVASADVFVYFGALEDLCRASRTALRPGGYLLFTVEKGGVEAEHPGYHLAHHGRFTHHVGYVKRALVRAGFEVRIVNEETMRYEGGEPVTSFSIAASVSA